VCVTRLIQLVEHLIDLRCFVLLVQAVVSTCIVVGALNTCIVIAGRSSQLPQHIVVVHCSALTAFFSQALLALPALTAFFCTLRGTNCMQCLGALFGMHCNAYNLCVSPGTATDCDRSQAEWWYRDRGGQYGRGSFRSSRY
jgi:hypothetical protein